MKPYKISVLDKCEECEEYPALIRFWNKRVLCPKCADESFRDHIQKPRLTVITNENNESEEIDE